MGIFSKSFNPDKDLPDLTGKVAIVTGSNTGIGYATVKFLARKGAKVYMGARNEEKALAALERLESEGTGNGKVVWLKLKLDDHRNAKAAAEEFLGIESRLDILVNNAALLSGPFEKNVDGIADHMMVNHFSPFVFTQTLLPLMKQTAQEANSDVRIVNVSSMGHKYISSGETHFRNLDDINQEFEKATWPAFTRYCYSKFANILWTKELQKRLDAEKTSIIVICLHPGAVNTFSDRLPPLVKPIGTVLLKIFFMHPDEGAHTSVIAAASSEVKQKSDKYKGAFLAPIGKIATPAKLATDGKLAEELWATTEKLLEDTGGKADISAES